MKKLIMVISIMVVCFLVIYSEEADAATKENMVEFTITEKMVLTGDGTNCELVANPVAIEIINTGKRGIIVGDIRAEGNSGWTLVDKNCDFHKMASNSRKISVTAGDVVSDEEHDLKKPYTINKTISLGEKVSVPISAKTGPVTEAVSDEHVLSLITTISAVETTLYAYPTVDFLASEETFDHSIFDYGITRTIVGANSIKVAFDRQRQMCAWGEEHSLVVWDKNFESPYDDTIIADEFIVPGDTATVLVDIVAPTGRGNKNIDIRTIEALDVVVTFIPLDENGEEIQLTDESIVYDEDMNIIPLIPMAKGGADA